MRAPAARNSRSPSRSRLQHRHGVGRRRGLEADGEEHHLPLAARARAMRERVERRIDHAHVAAARLRRQQICRACRARAACRRRSRGSRPGRAAMAIAWSISSTGVTQTGQPGPCSSVIAVGQHLVDAVADDRVGLAAADLHDRPGPRGDARDRLGECGARRRGRGTRRDISCRSSSAASIPPDRRASAAPPPRRSRSDREADVDEHVIADLRLRHVGEVDRFDDAAERDPARAASAGPRPRCSAALREPRGTSGASPAISGRAAKAAWPTARPPSLGGTRWCQCGSKPAAAQTLGRALGQHAHSGSSRR